MKSQGSREESFTWLPDNSAKAKLFGATTPDRGIPAMSVVPRVPHRQNNRHRIQTMSDISLELAKKRVNRFKEDSDRLMRQYAEGMECRDCEDWLESGIRAFAWLESTRDMVHQAAREGIDVPIETAQAIDALYRVWATPCDFAERWIADLSHRGYSVNHQEQFRECCAKAKEAINIFDMLAAAHDAQEDPSGFTFMIADS